MNWLQKISQWDDSSFQPYEEEINWLEMTPTGKRRWQESLDEELQRGRQEYGPAWERKDEFGKYSAKLAVFYEWWERVSGPLTGMMNMVNEYAMQTEGFSPLEEQNPAERLDTGVPSSGELEDWWG
jgi:hypothetical protein